MCICLSIGVPPFLAASWRLWCQLAVLIVPFCMELKAFMNDESHNLCKDVIAMEKFSENHELKLESNDDRDESLLLQCNDDNKMECSNSRKLVSSYTRTRYQEKSSQLGRYIRSIPLLMCSGFFLGIHFSSWVFSIQKTSLVHSLLWVSMGPIVINWGHWLFYGCCDISSKPSFRETLGAMIGIAGACIMLGDVRKSAPSLNDSLSLIHQPTLEGDLSAFIGAFAVSIYLVIGQKCREWMSLWLYAFPVVAMAAFTSTIAALLDEVQPSTIVGFGHNSVFGFFNQRYFLQALYLGAGPGVCGHTLLK